MKRRKGRIYATFFTLLSTLCLLLSLTAPASARDLPVKSKSEKPNPTSAKKTAPSPAVASPDTFAPVKQRLIGEGFSSAQVQSVYNSRPELMLKTVAATFRIRESKLNYDQFLEPAAIAKAKAFMESQEKILDQAESRYGVSRCVITAILLVETRFGSYTGKTPILAILSTFALMENEAYRNRVWAMLSPEDKERWDREAFDRKLKDRSQWAYRELFALMRIASSQPVKVATYRGSVMGALGWPQFLPSSLVQYGVDGNQDGRTDLFHPSDAILSTANYLRGYGWCQAKTQAEKEEVIHHYNHSRPYVNAVLGVADRLCENP